MFVVMIKLNKIPIKSFKRSSRYESKRIRISYQDFQIAYIFLE